jgi:hypothetical protein
MDLEKCANTFAFRKQTIYPTPIEITGNVNSLPVFGINLNDDTVKSCTNMLNVMT